MVSAFLIGLVGFAAMISMAHSAGIYEQCAGEGYGVFPCTAGLTCFRRNKWFSSCQTSCPLNLGWECEAYITQPAGTIAAGWDQCGGDAWVGPRVCANGFACYARSVYYSQCRPAADCPAGWACGALFPSSTAGPVILPVYSKCNDVGTAVCAAGTGCFRRNALYSECRPSCPATWACETDVAGANGQCGGDAWYGARICPSGFVCYARSAAYSQCRLPNDCPAGWACAALFPSSTVGPVILPAYSKCNDVGTAVCAAGTGCFRSNALYSECRPSCPATWACETDVAGTNGQCGGDAWYGARICPSGFVCYARSAAYSQCRLPNDCPADWACAALFPSSTAGPVVLPAYSKCNDVGTAVCAAGTGCFRSNALYSECRPSCPATWACETDVAGLNGQCGGEGYVGLTRCAPGYRCYVRSQWYSQCAASCPGADWTC